MAELQMLTKDTKLVDSWQIINNNFNSVGDIVFAMLGTIYPIGSIYTSTVPTNPADLFGMGTWERIGEGKCLIDCGDTYTAGSEGGSADAIIPYHTHEFTGDTVTSSEQSADHTHGGTTGWISADHVHNTWTGGASANHAHGLAIYESKSDDAARAGATVSWSYMGDQGTGGVSADHAHGVGMNGVSANHTHSFSTGGVSANHTHDVTASGLNSYVGTENNIVGANMQPYLAVYMWKRIA